MNMDEHIIDPIGRYAERVPLLIRNNSEMHNVMATNKAPAHLNVEKNDSFDEIHLHQEDTNCKEVSSTIYESDFLDRFVDHFHHRPSRDSGLAYLEQEQVFGMKSNDYILDKRKLPIKDRDKEFIDNLQARTRKYVVFDIGHGYRRSLLMQTPELLREVHMHNKSGTLQDTLPGALKLRDLRQIISMGSGERPSIEARRNCIVVNVPNTRAIILHGKVFLVASGYKRSPINMASNYDDTVKENDMLVIADGPNKSCLSPNSKDKSGRSMSLVASMPIFGIQENIILQNKVPSSLIGIDEFYPLLKKIEHISNIPSSTPFEFLVLEAILIEACNIVNREIMPMRQATICMIQNIRTRSQETSRLLQNVSDLKRKLNQIEELTNGLLKALTEMLGNEEDMRRLEISYYWDHPENWENPKVTVYHEEVENLMECYAQEVEVMLHQLASIGESLDDALHFMELELATLRNAMIKADLGLSVIATIIGFCGFFADCFGMNLSHGLDNTGPGLFWLVTAGLVSLCGAAAIVVLTTFRRINL